MAATDATSTNTPGAAALTMKLLIDSRPLRRRVVFAEAGKNTVDFLFSLLAMPAGTAVNLLGRESLAGCMGNLYSSAENLDGAYVHRGAAGRRHDSILCAAMQPPAAAGPNSWLFRLPEPAPAAPKKLFVCSYTGYSNCRSYVTAVSGTRCPNCNNQMVAEAKPVGPGGSSPASQEAAERKGFVQGMVTYTVTDDLVITPMSNVSCIALLNACKVRDIGSLQERTVQIGSKEALEIFRASLQSKTVLTDVFLGKSPAAPSTNNGGATRSLSNGGRRHECLAWRV